MALPHPLDLGFGGIPFPKGFNVGEFLFGCYGDTADGPPGFSSRGVAPEEDATTFNVNRAAYALAENDEYLESICVEKVLAVPEIGTVTLAAPSASIIIDPSGGGGGDVNYNGTLYMGEAAWIDNQENRDTLFQLLDANYNEVIVDGVEVKVTAVAGAAIGAGFVAVAVTLTLTDTVPAGSYRLGYGQGSTFETLPTYALMHADVRGLHEAPGESQRIHSYVLDASAAPTQPCDFSGPDALVRALATVGNNATLYLRRGLYAGPPGADWTISNDNLRIVGTGSKQGGAETFLEVAATFDLDITGTGVRFESVYFTPGVVGAGMDIDLSGEWISFVDCYAYGFRVYVQCADVLFENFTTTPYDVGFYFESHSLRTELNRVWIKPQVNPLVTDPAMHVIGSVTATDVTFDAPGVDCIGLHLACTVPSSFRNCSFAVDDTTALYVGASTARVSLESCHFTCDNGIALEFTTHCSGLNFRNCFFDSDRTIIDSGAAPAVFEIGAHFEDCTFNNNDVSWYDLPAVRLYAEPKLTTDVARCPVFHNCYFADKRSKGVEAIGSAPGGAPALPTAWFNAFTISGAVLDHCTIDRAGMDYVIFDAANIELIQCQVLNLQIDFGSAAMAPYEYDAAATTLGVIVLNGGYVRDLLVKGYFGGVWESPLIYGAGSSFTSATDAQVLLVDGCVVEVDAAVATWAIVDTSGKSLVFHASNDVTIRRFIWRESNAIGQSSIAGGDANRKNLIQLGARSCLEDSRISLLEGDTHGIDDVVYVAGPGARIVRTNIKVTQYEVGAAPWYSAFIRVGGTHCIIDSCTLTLTGATGSTVASSYHIEAMADGSCVKITSCHLVAKGDLAANSDLIIVHAATSLASLNGNTLQAIGGATAPTLNGGGYLPAAIATTNHLFQGATPAIIY